MKRLYDLYESYVGLYLSGTASEHTIPFANLDVDSSTTRPIVERSYITEEY